MSRTTPYLAALLGVLLGAVAVFWWQGTAATGGRARTEAIVHAYLLAHPEVITEAMGRLQDRELAQVVDANRAALATPVGSAWAGDPKGDVTVTEFYDYNCGYCRASLPTIAALLAADKHVKLVYREYPILAASSRDAARLSLAAAAQGRFAAFHDALYAAGPVTPDTLAAAAAKAGVDMAAARRQQAQADGQLAESYRLGRQLGMQGTPSWVVGDQVLVGAQTLDQLQAAIATARSRS